MLLALKWLKKNLQHLIENIIKIPIIATETETKYLTL